MSTKTKTPAKTTKTAKTTKAVAVAPAPEAEYIDLSPTEAVARVRAAFGSVSEVEQTIDGLAEVRKQAARAYRVWSVVAARAVKSADNKAGVMTGAAFAEVAGTSPMGVTRLVRVGRILSTKSGSKQDAIDVRSLVNSVGQTRKGALTSDAFKAGLAALESGSAFGPAFKADKAEVGTDGKTVTTGTKSSEKRERTISVEKAPVTLLEQIGARVPEYSPALLAEIAEAVATLAVIVEEQIAAKKTA